MDLIKNIVENTYAITTLNNNIKMMNKSNKKVFLLIAVNLLITSKILSKHNEKITKLEAEIEEMKSKGE